MSDFAHEWETLAYPEQMLGLHKPVNDRKGRLLLVACCRLCEELLPEGSRQAVEVGERWADGQASISECEEAQHVAEGACLTAEVEQQALAHDLAESEMLETPDPIRIAQIRDESNRQWWVYYAAQAAYSTLFDQPGIDEFRHTVQLPEPAFGAALLRDIFGNPFRPVTFSPAWRTDTAVSLARTMYESREFSAMPILADALQDAGCDDPAILDHCRDTSQTHVRGCWVTDLVLGKQ